MTLTAQRSRSSSRPSREAAPRADRVLAVAIFWIIRHCVIPDGFRRGRPFRPYEWQQQFLGHHYLVRGDAQWVPDNPVLAPAYVYRRSLMVGPQKLGKDPMEAAQICLEGAGPALFGGWAQAGDAYRCSDHGCRCGWVYEYDPGEPMGMHWPSPLIQVTAFSEKATDNTYSALRPMVELGPLNAIIPAVGVDFMRLPNGGRVETVTSEARSRLGARITMASQGELGIWDEPSGMGGDGGVADTQWRGLAGTGGRASCHTNAWDPAQQSVAQKMAEAAEPDVYVQFAQVPDSLSIRNKEERRRILRMAYPADVRRENGGHVDLDSIEAEARSLAIRDPAQAGRFFGNQIIAGSGKAFDPSAWKALGPTKRSDLPHRQPGYAVAKGTLIVIGGDGSKTDDWTALIATEVATGFQWPLGIWDPGAHKGKVPIADVDAALVAAFEMFKVWRLYFDPPWWWDEVAIWQGRWGEKVVEAWRTDRNLPMAWACHAFGMAIADAALSHDGDTVYTSHVGHAYKHKLLVRDDKNEPLWRIQKESEHSPYKVDAAVAGVLSWQARTDAIAAGVTAERGPYFMQL